MGIVDIGAYMVWTARNGDINGVTLSMKQLENTWNGKYRYPYVFLNDEPFTQDFKECVHIPFSAGAQLIRSL